MAQFQVELTIPPGTTEAAPAEAVLLPTVGYIEEIELLFPTGCLGLVGVRIMDENRQIAPLPAGWLIDNGKTISWKEKRMLQGPPFRVTVQGINRALDWSHKVYVRLEITRNV